MTAENAGTLVSTRRFDFPIERVFDAWLDPSKASKFLFVTPTGKMVRVEIDARVGGSFNITRCDGEDIEHIGTYLEIDRPRRLVFSFCRDQSLDFFWIGAEESPASSSCGTCVNVQESA